MNKKSENSAILRLAIPLIAVILFGAAPSCLAIVDSEGKSDTIPTERTEHNLGKFRSVLAVRDGTECTGTVIGPYTVLTAHHCTGGGKVQWNNPATVMKVEREYTNPYLMIGRVFDTYNLPRPDGTRLGGMAGEFTRYFTPLWWLELYQQAIDDDTEDRLWTWPAQHDQLLLFVPDLTPDFIQKNEILLPEVGANLSRSNIQYFLTATPGSDRQYANVTFLKATARSITSATRDGYLTIDPSTARAEPGNSGGVTVGVIDSPPGSNIIPHQFIVGTTQNSATDISPLGYTDDMTVNQKLTVKLNSLWVKARMADIDGDGLPVECDPDPVIVNRADENLCTASVGVPTGRFTHGYPQARLECSDGYFATGFKAVREENNIENMRLSCSNVACLSGEGECRIYFTKLAGYEQTGLLIYPNRVETNGECNAGMAISAINVIPNRDGDKLLALQFSCSPFTTVDRISVARGLTVGTAVDVTSLDRSRLPELDLPRVPPSLETPENERTFQKLPRIGASASAGMPGNDVVCDSTRYLRILDLRQRTRDAISGFQMICE